MKRDELAEMGWLLFDKLRCCGSPRDEYRNENFPDLSLWIFPTAYVFSIRYRNSSTKIGPTSTKKLRETLQSLKSKTT